MIRHINVRNDVDKTAKKGEMKNMRTRRKPRDAIS